MERHSMAFPKGVMNYLRKMAIERLKEEGLLEEKGWRPMARDIICVCVMLAKPSLAEMSLEEFRELLNKAKQ